MQRRSSPGGGDYKRHRSCGRIKKRLRARRHVATGRIEDAKVCALFICWPLVSHHSGEHPIPLLGGRILEGLACPVNGNFAACSGTLEDFPLPGRIGLRTLSRILFVAPYVFEGGEGMQGVEYDRVLGRPAAAGDPHRRSGRGQLTRSGWPRPPVGFPRPTPPHRASR